MDNAIKKPETVLRKTEHYVRRMADGMAVGKSVILTSGYAACP